MNKFFAWGNRNAASIYTGCIVAVLMIGLMIAQGMRHTVKEISHLRDKKDLISITEQIQLARVEEHKFIDFQSEIIYGLRQENERKDLYIMRANEVISALSKELSHAQAIIETLKEYLKKLGEWPPKVAPPSRPQPINPDDLAKIRSEA